MATSLCVYLVAEPSIAGHPWGGRHITLTGRNQGLSTADAIRRVQRALRSVDQISADGCVRWRFPLGPSAQDPGAGVPAECTVAPYSFDQAGVARGVTIHSHDLQRLCAALRTVGGFERARETIGEHHVWLYRNQNAAAPSAQELIQLYAAPACRFRAVVAEQRGDDETAVVWHHVPLVDVPIVVLGQSLLPGGVLKPSLISRLDYAVAVARDRAAPLADNGVVRSDLAVFLPSFSHVSLPLQSSMIFIDHLALHAFLSIR